MVEAQQWLDSPALVRGGMGGLQRSSCRCLVLLLLSEQWHMGLDAARANQQPPALCNRQPSCTLQLHLLRV